VGKLQAYDFDIEYVKGKSNVVVDALSRRAYLCSMIGIFVDFRASILVEYAKEAFAIDILEGKLQDDRYKVVEELILYKD